MDVGLDAAGRKQRLQFFREGRAALEPFLAVKAGCSIARPMDGHDRNAAKTFPRHAPILPALTRE
jgi:hypothetical protein